MDALLQTMKPHQEPAWPVACYTRERMDPTFSSQLPGKVRALVDQIEACCGLKVCIRYNDCLQADGPKVFAIPSGGAVRVEKVGGAHTIIKFNGDKLEEIGIEHCLDPLTVPVATHELLHLKHVLVDQAISRMRYLPGLGIDDSTGGLYNVLDYIEHLFVFREMNTLGLSDADSKESLRAQMSTISYLPAGPCRRIVALMGWLQVCFCFPNELKPFAAARLIEADLLDDARKLEGIARTRLKQDRIPLIDACLQVVGISPQYVELGCYRQQDGKWMPIAILASRAPISSSPAPRPSETR